jgi:hypothetical protein
MKIRILMLGVVFSLLIASCTKKDNVDNTTISPDEASINAKLDVISEDVSRIVEEQFDATYANGANGRPSGEARPPACPTISRVPDFGTPPSIGQTVQKTIDFGTACNRRGNTLSGIINISFVYNPGATSHTITYTFNNFGHNGRLFVGTRTLTKTLATSPLNSNVHPIVIMNINMTMTLPDGRSFTRNGFRKRELISGSMATANAMFQVDGNWTTTFPNNTTQTSTITTPLIIKTTCSQFDSPIVSGIITYVRNGNNATLDYGTGACDKLAVFTYNGIAHNIVIGN